MNKVLVRRIDNSEIALQINEVEAYDGLDDKASQASRGLTNRNATSTEQIIATPRIGVKYAGEIWANKKYRLIYK